MSSPDIEAALEAARQRGFLLLQAPCFGPERTPIEAHLVVAWAAACKERGQHHAWVMPSATGRWYVMLGFVHGLDAELKYVVEDFKDVFVRRLHRSPEFYADEPNVWCCPASDRSTAEATAEELAALDRRERDPLRELVFQVHQR